MDDCLFVSVDLDFWDDCVGAFEPVKVLRRLERAFPEAEIDPTDHQRVRLLQELEVWARADASVREQLVRQSWELYRTNGPTYRFIIPFPSGHRVGGAARRQGVHVKLPPGLPLEARERLVAFLKSLRLGEPTLDEGEGD